MAADPERKSAFGIPLLVGAVGFGLVAALLSFVYLKSEARALIEKYAGPDRKQVTVLVTAQDVQKGSVLRREVISQRKIPARFAHGDAIRAADFERYLGRVVEVNIAAGKPILKSFLDDKFPVDFSDTIPVGRRAMTVQVDEVNSVGGFIRPGNSIDLYVNIPSGFSGFSAGFITADLVDVIPAQLLDAIPPALLDAALSANPDDATVQSLVANAMPKDVILPVLQNVRVLATGRDAYREQLDALRYPQRRSERTFNTLTLDLSPREAALITAAIDKGDLLAILRNREDEGSADFSTVAAQDLFSNAFEMAQAEAERRTRVSVAAGVDIDGNLIDADGNRLMSAEQLAAAGLHVNENGELVDADGNVVDPNDLVVTADGRVLNKKQLAAAGFTVNASGQIVDADGNIVSADDIVITASGEVLTKQQLAAAGLSVNENGEIVDASGRVVDSSQLVITADGKILTTEQLAAAGLSVNENGEIVDADGNVVDPDSLIVSAAGELLSREQLAAAGLSVNEKGEIVDADGNVVDPNTLVIDENGNVVNAEDLIAAGRPRRIDMIIGGVSEDGVAKSTTLQVTD
ncbi:MAG: Flp pilus assembly protein CpaB [Gammaproteobacteria bacterium]|nr:Flp pilus assembly protein CpaB [Gammaproteobacteria bacterium]